MYGNSRATRWGVNYRHFQNATMTRLSCGKVASRIIARRPNPTLPETLARRENSTRIIIPKYLFFSSSMNPLLVERYDIQHRKTIMTHHSLESSSSAQVWSLRAEGENKLLFRLERERERKDSEGDWGRGNIWKSWLGCIIAASDSTFSPAAALQANIFSRPLDAMHAVGAGLLGVENRCSVWGLQVELSYFEFHDAHLYSQLLFTFTVCLCREGKALTCGADF